MIGLALFLFFRDPQPMRAAGLVAARKDGRQRYYSVVPSGVQRLRAEIDRFWTDELDLLVADAHRFAASRSTARPRNGGAPVLPNSRRWPM